MPVLQTGQAVYDSIFVTGNIYKMEMPITNLSNPAV